MAPCVEGQHASIWEDFSNFTGEKGKGETRRAGAVMGDEEWSFGSRSGKVYMMDDLLIRARFL